MQTEKILGYDYDRIADAADHGSYISNAVTLITPNLQPTELAQDAMYLVVESAYTITIIRLDTEGRPVTVLERRS